MNIYSGLCQGRNRNAGQAAEGKRQRTAALYMAAVVAMLVLAAGARQGLSQVVPSAYRQSLTISAGALATGQYLQYGERKQFGASGFLDVDTSHHIGAELEATWIHPKQVDNLHTVTYQAGPRFRINRGKYAPYVKVLAGVGEFSYPYHYFGTGGFFIVAPGIGVDYRINRRIHLRLADFEYTYWPQFSYDPGTTSPISSATISTGLRVRIF